MPSIPDFGGGDPHNPIDVESTWREFVRLVGGHVVEDLVSEPRTFKNADFFFPSLPGVAELKEIETEFDKSTVFREGFLSLLERVKKEDQNWRPLLFGGSGKYPKWFTLELIHLFRPPLSRILKKANRQIRETKAHLQISNPTGILVFVNDGFTALDPHFVRILVCDILVGSYSSIDCILYITVNRYVKIAGSNVPRLLWMPSYSKRAPDSLVHFVDDLGRKWYDFLETKIGSFSIPREEILQDNNSSKFLSCEIVLPSEKQ